MPEPEREGEASRVDIAAIALICATIIALCAICGRAPGWAE